jgi:hypothetical protein
VQKPVVLDSAPDGRRYRGELVVREVNCRHDPDIIDRERCLKILNPETLVREGAHTLSDFLVPTLSIECEPCRRMGPLQRRQAHGAYGDAKPPSCCTSSPIARRRPRPMQGGVRQG